MTNYLNCLNYFEINCSQIKLSKLSTLSINELEQGEFYRSSISYEEGPLLFSTPRMKLTSINDASDTTGLLEAEFLQSKANYYEKIREIDSYILDYLTKNSPDFFGETVNPETLDILFIKSTKLPKKLSTLPTMQLVVDKKNCKIRDRTDKKIDLIELREDYEVSFVLHLESVEFYRNKCTLRYSAEEIKVHNYFCPTSEFLMDDGESDSSEAEYINTLRD